MRRRLIPLTICAALVLGIWGVLQLHTSTADDPIDTGMLALTGGTFLLAAAVMVAGTSIWSLRSLGLLCTILADAGLYGNAALARIGWRAPLSEREIDLVRALFLAGGALLLIGLLRWIRQTRFGTTDGDPVP